MEFHGIEEFMRYLKVCFDKSDQREKWRALSGRDHVRSDYDTFIFTDSKVFQIKSSEVAPKNTVAVAREVGSASPDFLEMIRGGAPVPLNVISRAQDASAVIMFGMQQYSSDIADVLRREYYHSRQDDLKAELDRKVGCVIERPEYRSAYKRLREDQESYFS
jgi:hypothetical protein